MTLIHRICHLIYRVCCPLWMDAPLLRSSVCELCYPEIYISCLTKRVKIPVHFMQYMMS